MILRIPVESLLSNLTTDPSVWNGATQAQTVPDLQLGPILTTFHSISFPTGHMMEMCNHTQCYV